MKLRDKIDIGCRILKVKFSKYSIPLFIGWSITNRCNLNCIYCGRWNKIVKELKTIEIFSIIDELKRMGTKIISFTGGEPLIRDDIGDIVDYIHTKGMYANINTNGTLFVEKIIDLGNLNSVRFSLDGPREINDYIRGQGTFQKVVEAIKAAKNKKIKAYIVTVLSRHNISSIDYLIKLAEGLDVAILFQPVTLALLCSKAFNPHIPDCLEYKNTIDRLIEFKKQRKPIFNTIKGLLYLRSWPEGKNIFCYSKNVSCRIETDGYLYHCGRRQEKDTAKSCLAEGVKKAFDNLAYVSCNDCWCALRLELNYIASIDLEAIFSNLTKL